MMRIGLIRNPNSQRNRRIGDRLGEVVVPRQVELLRIDAATADDVPAVVREYGARGVTHLIVDGGDGTLREAMTALPPAFGTRLPTLSLVAGGNANLATSDVGGAGHGPQALQRLLDALANGQRGHVEERQPIELRWPDGSRPPVLGFFVGAAAFYKGWKLALGAVHDRGFMHGPAVAATMAGALWQTMAGGPRSDWQAGTMMGIAVAAIKTLPNSQQPQLHEADSKWHIGDCLKVNADYILHGAGYAQPQKFMKSALDTIDVNTNWTLKLAKAAVFPPSSRFLAPATRRDPTRR